MNGKIALDRVVGGIILLFGVLVVVLRLCLGSHSLVALVIGGILIASAALYLGFGKKILKGDYSPSFRPTPRIRTINHIIFFATISLIMWLLWSNLYYRPPLYFALCLVAAASIILDIFCLSEEKSSHIAIALSKIIALSLIIYAGIYYQFPGIYGADPWWHNRWIQETVSSGHITRGEFVGSGYYWFPIFHLTAATTQILTSLSTYTSTFASIGGFMAVTCVFVFLIGSKLVNTKAGLLAALIVPFTDYAIERATAIIPMSLGFCFFLVILYLIFCHDRKTASSVFLIILLSVSLILTHTGAAFITLVALIAIFIGIRLYERISKPATAAVYELVSLGFIALFTVAMLTRWMQGTPFFDWTVRTLVQLLQIDTQFALAAPTIEWNVPREVFVLGQGGFFLLLGFAVIGALMYLYAKNRTGHRVALILAVGILITLPYGFMLFYLSDILPGRWFLFLYAPLSILGAGGLLGISNLIKGKLNKLIMVTLVVLAIIFMMSTNSRANDDSPQIFNGATRIGFTQSELMAIETLSDMGCGRPKTDLYYGAIFPYAIDYDRYMDMVSGENEVFIERGYYLHHPEWNEKYMTRIHEGGIGKYQPEEVLILDYIREQGIDKEPLIYNSGNVKVYAMPAR